MREFFSKFVIKVMAFFGYEPYFEMDNKDVKLVWVRNWGFDWKGIARHLAVKLKNRKAKTSYLFYKRLPAYKVYKRPGSYFTNIENMTFLVKASNLNKAVKDSINKKGLYYKKIGHIEWDSSEEKRKEFHTKKDATNM